MECLKKLCQSVLRLLSVVKLNLLLINHGSERSQVESWFSKFW